MSDSPDAFHQPAFQQPAFHQPEGYHLAELNIARAIDDLDSPALAAFVNALDKINSLADKSPGFVWRLQDDSGNATDISFSDDPREITNMSVWTSADALEHYIWNTAHRGFMQRGDRWFLPPAKRTFVMWWVPVGHLPTLDEARTHLALLESNGPTPDAFDWTALPGTRLWQTAGAPPRKD